MKADWTIACVCAATLAVTAACSDETVVDATGGTGGTGAVEAGTGGTAGSGGAAGGSGAAGSGGTAASGGAAGNDGGAVTGVLLAATTDYFSSTDVASIDLASQTVLGTVAVADGDAIPAASAGVGFVLARTLSQVLTLSSTGKVDKTIDVGASAVGLTGSSPTNPSAIAAVPASGGASKAYVTLYDANRVAVVDLAGGTVSSTVDLAGYLGSADGDGAVDATGAVLDESTGRVYFALERVDRTTVSAPAFELACPTDKALLLAIDTTTDQLVDLNGSAAGEGIELGLTNPVDLALDSDNGRLLILSAGCFAANGDAGSMRTGFGVESVTLASGQVQTLLSPSAPDFLSRLLLLGGDQAVIDRFDATFAEHWSRWTIAGATLGPDLADVPGAPTADQQGSLWGLAFADVDGGTAPGLVRYDLATETGTQVASWQSALGNAAGTALVR